MKKNVLIFRKSFFFYSHIYLPINKILYLPFEIYDPWVQGPGPQAAPYAIWPYSNNVLSLFLNFHSSGR